MGPDPLTPVPSAPEERRASSGPRRSGRREIAAWPRSFSTAAASTSGSAAASRRSGSVSRCARQARQAIELGVHLAGAESLLLRDQHHGQVRKRQGLHPLARARDQRVARSTWLGTSEPRAERDLAKLARAEGPAGDRVRRPQHGRGIGATAAETRGHRDPLLDAHLERR